MLNCILTASSSICFCPSFTSQVVPYKLLIKIEMGQRQQQAEQIFHFLGKSMVMQKKFQVLCLEMCLRITHSE